MTRYKKTIKTTNAVNNAGYRMTKIEAVIDRYTVILLEALHDDLHGASEVYAQLEDKNVYLDPDKNTYDLAYAHGYREALRDVIEAIEGDRHPQPQRPQKKGRGAK